MNWFIDRLLRPLVVAVIVLATAAVIILHIRLPDGMKKEADFAATLVGAVAIIYTVLLTVQARRASSAARFAERWNAVDFTNSRKDVVQAIRGTKDLSQIDRNYIVELLNFFEEMSISIQEGEAQEATLRKFFEGVVRKSAAVFTPWIEQQQKDQPKAFSEYLKLVKRWK